MLEPSCTVTSSSSSSSCAPFHWDEQQSEPQQIESYTQYIRDQLKLPRNILLRSAPAHLLDTTSPVLPFDVSGTQCFRQDLSHYEIVMKMLLIINRPNL